VAVLTADFAVDLHEVFWVNFVSFRVEDEDLGCSVVSSVKKDFLSDSRQEDTPVFVPSPPPGH
jgi:hypothetical protein